MKKRLLSILLVLSFVLSAVPFGILADDTDTITKWDGLLYEGKFSVEADVSAEPDVYFAGSGIGDDGDLSSASYYHAYISGSTLKVDKCEPGKTENVGSAPVTATGNVTLSIAYSLKGAIYCWINGERVVEIEGEDRTPYGAEIAYDDVASSTFAIEGGLTLVNTGSKTATYNAKSYTFTTAGSKVVSYFSNRTIKDGYIVLSKGTATAVGGPMFGMKHNGTETGATMSGGRSFYLVDHKSGKYRFIVSDKAADAANSITNNASWTTYKNVRFTGYTFNENGNLCGWMFGGGGDANANVAFPSTALTINFNIGSTEANVSAGNISFTDKEPFGGQYYGVYSEAAANTTYTFYAVNNAVEAMDIDIVSMSTGVKVGETGEVTVKTIPEGSVINSGDSIMISGNGISQKGEAVDNGDGTYTITYDAIAAGETAITASVNNHIYGELSDTEAVSIAQPDTGKTRWDGILYEGKFSVKVDASTSTGVYFAANGITVAGDLSTASYYHAYIENSVLKVDKYENGAPAGNVGEKAVDATGTVMLSVAYSLNGAVSIWIEYDRVLDLSGCTPYGTQIAYDNEATDFTIVGELNFEVLSGSVAYDSNSYNATSTSGNALGYFTNRKIRDGKVVILGKDLTGSSAGVIFGMSRTNDKAVYELDGIGYYVADVPRKRLVVVDSITNAHYSHLSVTGGSWTKGNNHYMYSTPDLGGTLATTEFNLSTTPASIVLKTNSANATVTDTAPLTGGYYGVRIPTANQYVTFYAVNNEVEAMDIDFTGIAFNETTGVYTATLTTFPAGSVINSGDYIKVTGANLEQIGEMTDLGNGVYTVQFKTTATGTATAEFSVDNHIYGTLSASHTQEFVAHEHTGDFDSDNNNHWIDCGCGEQIEFGEHDKTGAIAKVEAGCTTPGTRSHVTCPTCNVTLYQKDDGSWAKLENDDDLIIPATGHVKFTHIKETPATCIAKGEKAHDKCECGAILIDGKVVTEADIVIDIDPTNHATDLIFHQASEATCVAPGGREYYNCASCGNNYSDADGKIKLDSTATDIDGNNHANGLTYVPEDPASCTETGTAAHYKCEDCGKLYSDENGKEEIAGAELIPATKHPNKYLVGYEDSTLNKEGYTGDYYCPDCDETVELGVTIPVQTGAVASVNGYKYATFAEAVANADGKTVILLDNVVLTEKITVLGTQTWDLGEYTLTSVAISDNYAVVVKGNLTIESGNFIIKPYYGIGVTGALTINGGNFSADGDVDYLVGNWGKTVINNGNFSGYYCCVNNFAGTTEINGGIYAIEGYEGEYYSATLLANAGLTVKGGIFSDNMSEYCVNGCTAYEEVSGKYVYGAHKYVAGTVVEATCMEGGYTVYTCECGDTYNGDFTGINASNHVISTEDTNIEWSKDDTHHWKECECKARLDEEEHTGLDCKTCGNKTIGVYKVGDDLYFRDEYGNVLTDKFYVTEGTANGLVTEGWYYADKTGKFIDDDFYTDSNGVKRYIRGGKAVYTRVTEIKGNTYFIDWDGVVLIDKIYVSASAASESGIAGMTEGWYYADKTGAFIKEGFYQDGSVKRYIVNGKAAYTRMTYIDLDGEGGEDGAFYFIDWDGVVLTKKYYASADSTEKLGLKEGWYYPDETGKFMKEGFYDDNGVKRYIVNGQAVYKRVTKIGDDYYMIEWNGVVVINTDKFYITESSAKANPGDGFPKGAGWYKTDEDGKIILD